MLQDIPEQAPPNSRDLDSHSPHELPQPAECQLLLSSIRQLIRPIPALLRPGQGSAEHPDLRVGPDRRAHRNQNLYFSKDHRDCLGGDRQVQGLHS